MNIIILEVWCKNERIPVKYRFGFYRSSKIKMPELSETTQAF